MAVELVTGYAGKAHVSSSEDGARQAGTVGTGMYALETVDEPLKATLENANTVTVGPGDVLINGRHVQLTGSTTFAVPVGTQGQQTSNLLVLRYEIAEDGTEGVTAVTLTGEPATSDPQDPTLATGSILDGDSPVDMPLYRVITTGIESAQPVKLFETVPPIAELGFADLAGSVAASQLPVVPVSKGGTGMTSNPSMLTNLGSASAAGVFQSAPRPGVTGTLPVSRGGTGVTTSGAIGLKAYPVGAVYISYVSTSPASLFGGTWTPITGRFPYFNAGTDTGGSNTVTLTVAQMPSHSHYQQAQHGSTTEQLRMIQSNAGPGTSWFIAVASNSNGTRTSTASQGGGGSHSNMPAYQELYAWRRTA